MCPISKDQGCLILQYIAMYRPFSNIPFLDVVRYCDITRYYRDSTHRVDVRYLVDIVLRNQNLDIAQPQVTAPAERRVGQPAQQPCADGGPVRAPESAGDLFQVSGQGFPVRKVTSRRSAPKRWPKATSFLRPSRSYHGYPSLRNPNQSVSSATVMDTFPHK